MTQYKELIEEVYKRLCRENSSMTGYKPSGPDLIKQGISRDRVRSAFGNMTNLHQHMQDTVGGFIPIETFLAEGAKIRVNPKKKVFVITTAVANTKANIDFLDTIDSYCKINDASIIVLPCEDKVNAFSTKSAVFDPIFNKRNYLVLNGDLNLNKNLSVRSIQVSANQINPTTGLQRIGNRQGTFIVASPKQFLEYGARASDDQHLYAVMTTGACTNSDYKTSHYISKRLSYIADHDHCMGAVIVELQDDDVFHFRHVQANSEGSFIDLAIRYNKDGSMSQEKVHAIYGDLHANEADVECVNAFSQFVATISNGNVGKVFLHDVFNGKSISHHTKDIGDLARRRLGAEDDLESELYETAYVIDKIAKDTNPEEIVVVKSNHDEWLHRYLKEGRYIDDPQNHLTALRVAIGLFESDDVLEYALKEFYQKDFACEVTFLPRDVSYAIAGVECGAHGDLGSNGSKASLNQLEKIYKDCVVGHAHSGAIQRGVFRVGTFTPLRLEYNRGPSSWTQTGCLLYDDGTRQLVNFIDHKFSA